MYETTYSYSGYFFSHFLNSFHQNLSKPIQMTSVLLNPMTNSLCPLSWSIISSSLKHISLLDSSVPFSLHSSTKSVIILDKMALEKMEIQREQWYSFLHLPVIPS